MAQKKTSTQNPSAPDLSDIESMGYEEAREELVRTVAQLEAGGTALEESLALWERGEALANRCEQWLDGARERLEAARERREEAQGEDSSEGAEPVS
ncbi:exodeoxyribonuclease VII small subunit [Kocuria soli]|uniref:Exodeoxyribonuclease 7 small subunit n=1 Tax=Kocuria soli TaxID=2485125 RepID=A0A3N3ZQS5_9MICC|nr:exodeoxyribonuclease VII small subunit [Kocuria soli]ROZ63565.1 exodeoxyribonuclease VII small subunit [Kocuria soli]